MSKSKIEALLERVDPNLIGDRGVQWPEGKTSRPCPKEDQLAHASHLLQMALTRRSTVFEGADAVRKRLAGCKPTRRCFSGACLPCVGTLQHMVVHAGRFLFLESDQPWVVASIVPGGHAVRYGCCHDDVLLGPVTACLHAIMDKAGLAGFGGLDVSANEHRDGAFPDHYRPHGSILLPGMTNNEARARIAPHVAGSVIIRRPLVVKPFDGRKRGFAYAIKREPDRRITIPTRPGDPKTARYQNTRIKPLLELQRVELAIALDREGLGARLFLHGYLLEVHHGRPRLVPTDTSGSCR